MELPNLHICDDVILVGVNSEITMMNLAATMNDTPSPRCHCATMVTKAGICQNARVPNVVANTNISDTTANPHSTYVCINIYIYIYI